MLKVKISSIFRLTGSLRPGHKGFSNLTDVEHAWGFDIIPVLLGKWVDTGKILGFFRITK